MPKKDRVKPRDFWKDAADRATKLSLKAGYKDGTNLAGIAHKEEVEAFQTEKSKKKDKKPGGLDRRLLRLANRKKKALDFYPRAKGSKPARRKERAATRYQKTLTKRNRRSPLFNESGEKKRKISSTTRTLNRKIKTFQKRKSSYSRAIAHGKAASAEYKATGKVTAKGKRELWKMAKEGERFARQVAREKRIKKRIKK